MLKPFQRGPFELLPQVPTRPHDDERATRRELHMRSSPFGEMRAYVRELGEGAPLLLVHGLMTSGYSFRYIIGELSRKHRVVVVDLPGAGRTTTSPGLRYDAASLATWLGEFVDTMDIRGCQCVGNSLGGYLCMRAAIEDPALFSRLVNIHSPAVPQLRYHALRALGLPLLPTVSSRLIAVDPERWVHRNVHYYDESLKSLEEAREYAYALQSAAGRENFVSYLKDAVSARGFAEFEQSLRSRPFPIPLLLLYARKDPMVDPIHGAVLRRLVPQAQFQWVDNSSHFMHVDNPEPVLSALDAFLG